KARYIGASSMFAWQFAKALAISDLNGWTRFVSMQDHYNLLYREEEREMLPLCADQEIGVIPWSPLARGGRPPAGPAPAPGTPRPRAPRPTNSAPPSTATRTSRSSPAPSRWRSASAAR